MRTFKRQALAMLLLTAGALLFSCAPGGPRRQLVESEKAQLDIAAVNTRGVVEARYLGPGGKRIKARITRSGGTDYNYDLDGAGAWGHFTLTEGDGEYTITVFEQLEGTTYLPVLSHTLTLALDDADAPFLEPCPFVDFTPGCAAARRAAELTAGMDREEDKIAAVFGYVTERLHYDEVRSATVQPGYRPDVDAVLESGEGICLDYAAVMSAMLRSQGVPCRTVVGYAGSIYHAWVEVRDGGGGWRRMDPTFVSSRGDTPEMAAYIEDDGNYTAVYRY